MNTAQLKDYAPRARKAFIAAVEAQAARLGITAKGVADAKVQGDVLLVGGQALPKAVAGPREKLAARVRTEGFAPTMEAIAYTWFNRFAAIRYMELHGYLEHGFRVLGHPQGQARPEIMDHAADVELPGLDRGKAVELKLDGTKDEDLYRLLLTAQCNALHAAMPFLFERIGDETELLLPANLLHTDSLVRQLVEQVDEALWQEIEIIGWLYQFYISEKKDEVIGSVVKSEDIPAATQLFTPNWIVKYLVQNSLGAQWLATYPKSPLKGQMEFYIEPAEQTAEVKAQLAGITPLQLNPEELTLIDPACGSGHILVEAYELLKAIYLERGYRQRDVAQQILDKNLFGLDIDERAAQLTGFALMMKGRADDRRLFERGVKINVTALVDSTGFDADGLAKGVDIAGYGLQPADLTELRRLFEHARTFGSLIQVPEGLAKKLPALKQLSESTSQGLFVSESLKRLRTLVRQAERLSVRYDAVVANPPYMGSGAMNTIMKRLAKDNFPDARADLFACFIERGYTLAKVAGRCSMITMQSWMFLSSFEAMRNRLLREKTIQTMAHLGARAFGSISGEVVQTTAFVLGNGAIPSFKPTFLGLQDGGEDDKRVALISGEVRYNAAAQKDFESIPGSPIAYWASPQMRRAFARGRPMREVAEARRGVETGDNERFLRQWHEVSWRCVGINCEQGDTGHTWYPYNKGGGFRKWYGNRDLVINWRDSGHDIKKQEYPRGSRLPWRAANEDWYFKSGLTWGGLSSADVTFRLCDYGAVFDSNKGSMMFPPEAERLGVLALLNSKVVARFLAILNPTISTQKEDVGNIAYMRVGGVAQVAAACVRIARDDDNATERSWEFQGLPILAASTKALATLEDCCAAWRVNSAHAIAEMKGYEEENNRLCSDAYGLADEVNPEVPIEHITLTVNPAYRYGGKLTEEEQGRRFRRDTMQELVSYTIGCMMGRYSLDAPGLIYAHSGNEGFDPGRYTTFPADADGIVPITDTEWFDDDAAHRVMDFIAVAWDAGHLEDNLTYLADNLAPRQNESSRETVRRYLCDSFFKDHLQAYKKRPIYWLFSSGKQKAFHCLVYLHRYNAGTLARMRSEYVIPLQGKMAARLDKLQGDIQVSTSTAHQKRLEKERSQLAKQQVELLAFDEKLRHYADRRITLDLDDGVKVNYGKFGDLLAEVKAVTGGAEED